jgi:hypothetical protein
MILRNGKFSGKILRKIFRMGKFSTSHHYPQTSRDAVEHAPKQNSYVRRTDNGMDLTGHGLRREAQQVTYCCYTNEDR